MITNTFNDFANNYQNFRPDYPDLLLTRIETRLPRARSSEIQFAADIGAGKGISTRAVTRTIENSWFVIGVELNNDIRFSAREIAGDNIHYIAGNAEKLPFDKKCLGLLTVGQALQFFEKQTFYQEVECVLQTRGLVAIFQNERQWQNSEFLNECELLVETLNPSYCRNYRKFDSHAELDELSWTIKSEVHSKAWSFAVSIDNFIGMTLSRSTMKRLVFDLGEKNDIDKVRHLAEKHCRPDGQLCLHYKTELYLANRA